MSEAYKEDCIYKGIDFTLLASEELAKRPLQPSEAFYLRMVAGTDVKVKCWY